MAVDSSIPLGVKTPTVADLLNNASAFQNFRSGQIDLAGKEAANQVNPNNYTNEQGQLDTTSYNKSMNDALYGAGAGSQAPQYQQNRMAAEASSAHARQSQFELHNQMLTQNQQDISNRLAQPVLTHSDMKETADKMREDGRLDPGHYQQFLDTLKQSPDDTTNNKLILTNILGGTLQVQQRLPKYEWRQNKEDKSWQQWQINPNGVDPSTGKSGLHPVGGSIPSSELREYTDENNVKRVIPEQEYQQKVVNAARQGSPGMQVGAAPGTQADIQQGAQQRGANQQTALQSQQEIAPLKQARSIIDEHKDDPMIFGTGSDLGKRVGLLAATLGIPFTDIATTSAELKARGIDPSQNTYQSARYNLDSAIGAKNEAIFKNQAQLNWQQQHGNDPASQKEFEAAWNKVDRNASILLSKDNQQEQQDYYNRLSKSQQQSLKKSLMLFKSHGVY